MDKFINITDDGNEKAIRRGSRVPENAVNMAWVKSPRLTPENNIVIIDTSRIVEENSVDDSASCKIMYANTLGILEDEYGNQIVDQEYPAVADVFSIDEDFLTTPGSEYRAKHILGFVHVSRYFHIDFPGLTLGTIPQTYRNDILKIVDSNGREYVNDDGTPRYRIQITPGNVTVDSSEENSAYRVFAFVDTDTNEDLYLKYNKVEVTAEGRIVNQNINHSEILNPQPYFQYRPEESDVVDLANRNQKWYSTKPATLKEQILNVPTQDVDGYKVYVPKKAIGDPRMFQLFRWRASCEFTETYKVDPTRDASVIRCGVLTLGEVASVSPFAFYNLENSQYNASGVKFVNPLQEGLIDSPERTSKAYWEVDFKTVTNEQLKQFDILLLAPLSHTVNFSSYNAKIKYFTDTLGRTLFIETHNYTQIQNFGFSLSRPVKTTNAAAIAPGPGTHATGTTIRPASNTASDPLFDGDGQLGGWEINDGTPDELLSISPFRNGAYSAPGYHQYIISAPSDYKSMLISTGSTGTAVNAFMKKNTAGKGSILISTIGIGHAPNVLYSDTDGRYLYANRSANIHDTPKYTEYINGYNIEGVMKLFYNVCLLSVKNAILDSSDEQRYSSSWKYYSPWKSSWVINGDVLFEDERDSNDFVFLPKDPTILEPVWQRKLSNKTFQQLIDENLSSKDLQRVAGSTRKYDIEITNGLVEGPITISDNIKPYAYTEAYSPPFTVPVELGPHVIREDPIQGEYDTTQYTHKSYPPKPFQVQVQANYDATSQSMVSHTVTVRATGTATENIKSVTPMVSTNTELSWTSHGSGVIFNSGVPFEYMTPHAHGISSWQQSNYYTNSWGPGNRIWNHFGLFGRFTVGSRGEVVAFIQEAMNRFMWWGFFNGGIGGGLAVDGYYGSTTSRVIRNFQTKFGARYIDGVVDAETLSIIGAQILRLAGFVGHINPNDHTRFFAWVNHAMYSRNISDKNPNNKFLKRSWISGGPSIIWELFGVTFNQQYDIHGISLTPAVDGSTRNLMWRSIDIRTLGHYTNLRPYLSNYNSEWGKAIYMPRRPADGQKDYVPIGPYRGDTIIVGIGQDRSSGFGTSRVLGLRDLVAHAKTLTGGKTINTQRAYNFSASKTLTVSTSKPATVQLTPPYNGKGSLSGIRWSPSITSSNPEVSVSITASGKVTAEHNEVIINNTDNYSKAPMLPGGGNSQLYYIDENSKSNPIPESGWIAKTDGIKLLSDSMGRPVGFPSMPVTIGANEAQRHYATLNINNYTQDPSVLVGFYDFREKEFIVNAAGDPEISYIEYLTRGPQNIYIGLISTYEVETDRPIPVSEDAPLLPFKWAMPVYGVCQKGGSRIGIEPLPNGLGPADMWSVPIRTGKFNRVADIRSAQNGPLTGWLGNYQGRKIKAFYSVTEAERGGWSSIFGRPNVDIVDETPFIVDDSVIQVRQYPILMIKEPTVLTSQADPVRPVFSVSVRDSIDSAWRLLRRDEILDYNVSEGTIFLKNPLASSDPNLVKVSYTTSRKTYQLKTYNGQKLNLNPYPGHSRDLIGRPIYIYIVPAYAKDSFGKVIPDSVVDKTVRFTLDSGIFDQLDPDYDPLAVQLGVVYITTALDIKNLTVLDTRRRGGGLKDSVTKEEINRMIQESIGYWDVGHGAGISYQRGGFVIVRLPVSLKEQFSDPRQIEAAIRRNISAGVGFKIEDLNGNDWS